MSNPDYVIVGLLGRKGAGKSTISRRLRELYGARVLSFAAPLKEMTHVLLNSWPTGPLHFEDSSSGELRAYERDDLDDPEYKEHQLYNSSGRPLDITPRWLMQKIGTEMVRYHLGADVWVDALMAKAARIHAEEGVRMFVVDDTRFVNECSALNLLEGKVRGYVVKVVCTTDEEERDKSIPLHPSEAEIDLVPPKWVDGVVSCARGEVDAGLPDLRPLLDAFAETWAKVVDVSPELQAVIRKSVNV